MLLKNFATKNKNLKTDCSKKIEKQSENSISAHKIHNFLNIMRFLRIKKQLNVKSVHHLKLLKFVNV